ncbi:hypothetical protein MIR68_002590 [Amoeboaphelidium protococcarum]|nr:hypothetical protein MIR68_002590 [Amoeboaphelidium protococcarum]
MYDMITFTQLPSHFGDIPGYKADLTRLMSWLADDQVGAFIQQLDVTSCLTPLYEMVDGVDSYRASYEKPFFIYGFDYTEQSVIDSMVESKRLALYQKIFYSTYILSLRSDERLVNEGKLPLCMAYLIQILPNQMVKKDLVDIVIYLHNPEFSLCIIKLIFGYFQSRDTLSQQQQLLVIQSRPSAGSNAEEFVIMVMQSAITHKRVALAQLLFANYFHIDMRMTRQFFVTFMGMINTYGSLRDLIKMLAVLENVRDFTLLAVEESEQSQLSKLSFEVLTQKSHYDFVRPAYSLLTAAKDLAHAHPVVIASTFQTMSNQQVLAYFQHLPDKYKTVFLNLKIEAQLLLVNFGQFSFHWLNKDQFHRLSFSVRLALLKREAPVVQSEGEQNRPIRPTVNTHFSGHIYLSYPSQKDNFQQALLNNLYDNNIVKQLRQMYLTAFSSGYTQSMDFDRLLLRADWAYCRKSIQIMELESRQYCLLLARVIYLRKQQNPHDGFMADISTDQPPPPPVDPLQFHPEALVVRDSKRVYPPDMVTFAPQQGDANMENAGLQTEEIHVLDGGQESTRKRRLDSEEVDQYQPKLRRFEDNFIDGLLVSDNDQ